MNTNTFHLPQSSHPTHQVTQPSKATECVDLSAVYASQQSAQPTVPRVCYAWAAGFLDDECCIRLTRITHY